MSTPDLELVRTAMKAARKQLDPCHTRHLPHYEGFYYNTLQMVQHAYAKAGLTTSKEVIEQQTVKIFREVLELEGEAGDIESERNKFRYFG